MIAFTAFSQNNYPRPLVIDGDTIEAITRPQMRSLILLRYAADECDSQRAVLMNEVQALASISQHQDTAFHACQEEISGYEAEVQLLNARIRLKDDELQVNKDLMKRKKRQAIGGGVTGVIIAAGIGFITGFLIHK